VRLFDFTAVRTILAGVRTAVWMEEYRIGREANIAR
jgi:hypothetical protein